MQGWIGLLAMVMMIGGLTALPATARADETFFVATNGNDEWSGRLAAPNQDGSDGPFATLQRARDAVRALKAAQGGTLKQAVTVQVRGGRYYLDEPLVFTPEDSGGPTVPVTWAAYQNEEPTISGGRAITNWGRILLEGRTLWVADLPEVRAGRWSFAELWVNGERRPRARHPNRGYLEIAEAEPTEAWHQGQARFRFKEGDVQAWPTIAHAEVITATRWVESHLPVVRVDETERWVEVGKRNVFQLSAGDLYYLENALEALDAPGEWYLDPQTGRLYYMPMLGETPDRLDAVAPVLSQLVRWQGEPALGQWVEHLRFRGLTFSHAEWHFPQGTDIGWPAPDVGGFGQAAVGVPGALYGEGVRHLTLENCTLAHLGTYGLELARGCQQNRIAGCTLTDLGAGGIKLGETTIRQNEAEQTFANEVSDCTIAYGGRHFHSAIGIWVGQSYDNRLVHNEIHDFYYSGFSIGWTWGYGDALAHGNLVEYNHVHHIGVQSDGDGPILSDMGGIYTLGKQPGTVIRNNVWHDIAGRQYGGWGIYFDEGSSDIVAENNLVYRTTHGGFHQHYGKENIFRRNVIAFARDWQIQRSRPEEHLSFTFEDNVVYWSQGQMIAGNLGDFHFAFDRNLYWYTGDGEVKPAGLSWQEWQSKGMDLHSRFADPGFADPQNGNFSVPLGSPVLAKGIRPKRWERVGPRGKR